MQWVIDLMTEWAALQGFVSGCYVNKPDPNNDKLALGDLTVDGAWHEIDCSGFIPPNSTAVNLAVKHESTAVDDFARFRGPGDTGTLHRCTVRSYVANVMQNTNFIMGLSADSKFEYYMPVANWTEFIIRFRGYFL